jgi:hypothetical protein
MSIAGSRSWRGDEFQLRIALHYLIRVLDDELAGLQCESNGLPGQAGAITVDDVVALLKDGKREYVQAKKNQPDHENWKLSDPVLREELKKARDQLESDPSATVRFFSRSQFGEFKKLHEDSLLCPDEQAFRRSAGRAVQDSLNELAATLDRSETEVLGLLQRMSFGTSREFDEWDRENRRDLERILPAAPTGLLVLERFLAAHQSHLRGSTFVVHRADVLNELERHGLAPAPLYSDQETLALFRRSSQIGRLWPRDIAGRKFQRAEFQSVLSHLQAGAKTILVSAGPGCGKTCLLLDLADELEAEGATAVLFVKGDRFAGAGDEAQLQDNGMPPDIIGRCARLAASRRVVVLLDSLDVLSISRNHGSLRVFLGLLERLEKLDGVTVVAACRDFDLRYDPQSRGREWQARIPLTTLHYSDVVAPLLKEWGVETAALHSEMRTLLGTPQHLRLFHRLIQSSASQNFVSPFQLYERFIEEAVTFQPGLGDGALQKLEDLAAGGVDQRRQTFPRASLDVPGETLQQLISSEILIECEGGSLAFGHQTLAESLAVRRAIRKKQTLAAFILAQPPLPFVRPTVRAFFFCLLSQDKATFRRQVWEVVSHGDIAYHLKRLVAESLAETTPDDHDWPLIRRLFTSEPDLYRRAFAQAQNSAWFELLRKNWLPLIKQGEASAEWRYQYVSGLDRWLLSHTRQVIELWTDALEAGWAPKGSTWRISIALSRLSDWSDHGLSKLFELLVVNSSDHDMLTKPLSSWISATDDGDRILWQLMTREGGDNTEEQADGELKIRCAPHSFHDEGFLVRRLERSDELMSLATDYLELSATQSQARAGFSHGCLHQTSWTMRHTRADILPADDSIMLVGGVERALKKRAQRNDSWWQQHEPQMRQAADLGIRYMLIEAYQASPITNSAGIEAQLADRALFRFGQMEYELGALMAVAYGHLPDGVQDANQNMILHLYDDFRSDDGVLPDWATEKPYQYALWIPRPFRSPELVSFLARWADQFGEMRPSPRLHSWGGAVAAPISREQLADLDVVPLLRILSHYLAGGRHETELVDQGRWVGGLHEVQSTLRQCAAYEPGRFLNLLEHDFNSELVSKFGFSVLEGIAEHLRYVAGTLAAPEGWSKITTAAPQADRLAAALIRHAELALCDAHRLDASTEYSVSRLLEAVADTTESDEAGERLVLSLWRVTTSNDPEPKADEEAADFGMVACNSTRGITARSAMSLYCRWLKLGKPIPRLLPYLLRRCASDPSLGVRVSILERLPFVVHHCPELGWTLFHACFREPQGKLWLEAERLFYYQYRGAFEVVKPLLQRMHSEALDVAGEAYGRIATLCYLAGHAIVDDGPLLSLATNDSISQGIAQVLCANLGHTGVAEKCRATLVEMLKVAQASAAAQAALGRRMASEHADGPVDPELVLLSVGAMGHLKQARDTWGLCKWLERNSSQYPLVALEICEKLIALPTEGPVGFSGEMVPILLELLREADETDDPELISRVVKLQDRFLSLDVLGVDELLNNSARS